MPHLASATPLAPRSFGHKPYRRRHSNGNCGHAEHAETCHPIDERLACAASYCVLGTGGHEIIACQFVNLVLCGKCQPSAPVSASLICGL